MFDLKKTALWLFVTVTIISQAQTVTPQEKQSRFSKNADAYSVEFLPFNSANNDFCGCYYMDAIVFTSTRERAWLNKKSNNGENYAHLYTTEKNAKGKYLKPKAFMADLTTGYNDGPVCFTRDFSAVYFARINSKKTKRAADGSYKMNLYMATLNRSGFDSVVIMPFNSPEYNLAHPALSPDGNTLFFASDMPGGFGGMDVYMSKKENGVWGKAINLGDKINTAADDVFPFLSAENKLYFSTSGLEGMGGIDIYEAHFKDGKVSRVYNMGEPVNSVKDDFGFFLGSDSKTGFISSDRREGETADDLYELRILREVKRNKEVRLIVKDKSSTQPLANTQLIINGDTVRTDSTGSFVKSLEEGIDYKLKLSRNDYFDLEDQVSAASSPEDEFSKELFMAPDPKLALVLQVRDAKTGILIDGVTLKLTDSLSGTTVSDLPFADGDYRKKLSDKKIGDRLVYSLSIEKPGYLSKTVQLRHTIDKAGDIRLHELADLSIGKVEVGMDLAKMIDIKPIYFDLGKSTIRKDAALELDKIVEIMQRYPNMSIELGSHTDCRSAAASNMKLSTARAKASAAYIVKKGINKSRITGKGYGESKLLNDCACEGKTLSPCSEEEHTKNRRTEFIITRMQ